jgi:hypothetical protein
MDGEAQALGWCPGCGEPIQGDFCQNCGPVATHPTRADSAFARRAMNAVAAALLAAENGAVHAVGECPSCRALLIVTPRRTDHWPPSCADWARHMEDTL